VGEAISLEPVMITCLSGADGVYPHWVEAE
jgi:hypothetical protein